MTPEGDSQIISFLNSRNNEHGRCHLWVRAFVDIFGKELVRDTSATAVTSRSSASCEERVALKAVFPSQNQFYLRLQEAPYLGLMTKAPRCCVHHGDASAVLEMHSYFFSFNEMTCGIAAL